MLLHWNPSRRPCPCLIWTILTPLSWRRNLWLFLHRRLRLLLCPLQRQHLLYLSHPWLLRLPPVRQKLSSRYLHRRPLLPLPPHHRLPPLQLPLLHRLHHPPR